MRNDGQEVAADPAELLVSVVVIGRNEGKRLERCLQSIAAMVRDGFTTEVIYADSGSVDDSIALAEASGAKVIALHPERPTAALGRNAGWRAAQGEIILFLDGDTILDPRFVVDSLAEFADPEIAVVWGHRREIHPEQSVYNRVLDLDWIYRPGLTDFCGGDALFRRAALEQAEGFDQTLIAGEEPELCGRLRALGWKILHVDRPMTGHDLATTRWRQYWKRATRAGHAYAEVSERFRATESPLWSAESKRNCRQALVLLAMLLGGAIWSLVRQSVLPFGVSCMLLLALAIRSAWKSRWKSNDGVAVALYGLHSHVQQIPIFAGQLQYWWNRRRGMRAALLEYKEM